MLYMSLGQFNPLGTQPQQICIVGHCISVRSVGTILRVLEILRSGIFRMKLFTENWALGFE